MTGLLLAALIASSPAAISAEPANLADFGLVCFCTSRLATPHGLVLMDNNGRILSLAREPITRAELSSAGAPALDSQLLLLRDWGLLTQNGDRYATAFPVLGPGEMARLRGALQPIADQLAADIGPDVAAIAAELRRRGQGEAAYATLFAYVLDGLVWRKLEVLGRLPGQQIDLAHPYWAGTFWAVFPKQNAMPGTNSSEVGKASLRMMWTPPTLRHFAAIADAPATKAWLAGLDKAGPESAIPPAPPALAKVVVVDERRGDPLFVRGQAIANRIAPVVVAADLASAISHADDKQRTLIATHELIWMLLERSALRPPAVAQRGAGDLAELAPLLVVAVRGD